MNAFPFFKKETKDKRRLKDEEALLNVAVTLLITKAEKAWLVQQSGIECNSVNGLIRHALRVYRKSIESNQE